MCDVQFKPRDLGGVISVLIWVYVFSLAAVCLVADVALVLLGALLWDPKRRTFHAVARFWGGTLARTLPFYVELRGLEHAAHGPGPFIVAPNHQSVIDLLVTYLLPLPFRTVVKRSWFYGPFGLGIRLAGYIPTTKTGDPDSAAATLASAGTWLGQGISLLMFPEATRSHTWSIRRFKRGPFELAANSGTAVLPVAIAGTNDVAHPSTWRFAVGGRIVVEVLPPIEPGALDGHALRDATRAALDASVATLRLELHEKYGQGPPVDAGS